MHRPQPPRRQPATSARRITGPEAAALLAEHLHSTWPHTHFHIKITDAEQTDGPPPTESASAAAGSTGLQVIWTDGPTEADVETAASFFVGVMYDRDSRTIRPIDSLLFDLTRRVVERVQYGVTHVTVHRRLSRRFRHDLTICACALLSDLNPKVTRGAARRPQQPRTHRPDVLRRCEVGDGTAVADEQTTPQHTATDAAHHVLGQVWVAGTCRPQQLVRLLAERVPVEDVTIIASWPHQAGRRALLAALL